MIDALPDVPGDFTLVFGVYRGKTLLAEGKIGVRLSGATPRVIEGALSIEGALVPLDAIADGAPLTEQYWA